MLFQDFDSQFSQDFNIYFLLKFESIPNKKKFQQNHFRGKKSKNLFLEKSFFFEKVRFSRVFLGVISVLADGVYNSVTKNFLVPFARLALRASSAHCVLFSALRAF